MVGDLSLAKAKAYLLSSNEVKDKGYLKAVVQAKSISKRQISRFRHQLSTIINRPKLPQSVAFLTTILIPPSSLPVL